MKKVYIVGILTTIVLILGVFYFAQNNSGVDLTTVTVQFLPDNSTYGKGTLTPQQQQIKDVAFSLLQKFNHASEENRDGYTLLGVGHTYVVMRYYPATSLFPRDYVIDLKKRTVHGLETGYSFQTRDTIVYIFSKRIAYLKLDQGFSIELPNSLLGADETYEPSDGLLPKPEVIQTESSFAVSIFTNESEYGSVEHKKVREQTFQIP
ncbi:MAG: hypothetical protein AB203_03705 [Parcubacteria bacterium C7867-008]|nr:MAG: hypothetical protein AB203_03705 [Parcubacteria bacterium C7867-008]